MGAALFEERLATLDEPLQNFFRNAKQKGRRQLSRREADVLVQRVLRAARQANADDRLEHRISRLAVFGSYLSDKPFIGDLDVLVDLQPRGDRNEERFKAAFPCPIAGGFPGTPQWNFVIQWPFAVTASRLCVTPDVHPVLWAEEFSPRLELTIGTVAEPALIPLRVVATSPINAVARQAPGEVDCAIAALTRLYTSGEFPKAADTCAEMAVQYMRLRRWNLPGDLRQMYLEKREGHPLASAFGPEGVIATVLEIAAALGLRPRTDPHDVQRGDLLFLRRSDAFMAISTDGLREAIAVIDGQLVSLDCPRIHAAWDAAPPP